VGIQQKVLCEWVRSHRNCQEWHPNYHSHGSTFAKISGYEAAQKIKGKAYGQDIEIIAVTASILEIDKEKVTQSMMNGYLQKPFKEQDLFSLIEQKMGDIFDYYEDTSKKETEVEKDFTLGTDLLANIPQILVDQLKTATINANFDQMLEVIEKMVPYSKLLAERFSNLTNNFQYEAILKIIEKDKNNGS
jgi:CheY-like chemotaxis protein